MRDYSIKYKKLSRFFKWVITIAVLTAAVIVAYLFCASFGLISQYEQAIKDAENNGDVYGFKILTFSLIAIVAIGYIIISLYNLLSHRAVEDSRIHCLPFIMTPIFLIIENALLHLFGDNDSTYYQVTLGVFTTTVLGVVTFASLKFSFEISNKQKRFVETSDIKPDILIGQIKDYHYSATVTRNKCYLCGVYIGKIHKLEYVDIKKTGNLFIMNKLLFPNTKRMFKINSGAVDIELKDFVNYSMEDIIKYARKDSYDVFLIFKDMENYYYFAQIPNQNVAYNVIGVNEHMMNRLVYLHNKQKYKKRKTKNKSKEQKQKNICYETMDWFKLPYNFHVKDDVI